eukprot:scaffold224936_cov53-Attheya_sp.AAC.1
MTVECIRDGQWQLRLKAVVRGMVICLRYGGRWWWRGKWENGLNARMGYSGGSGGGGDFLARILVHKKGEGRLSETGWILVE